MKINGTILPNNPMQAYLMGKRHGSQETMDMVGMALTDKFGFHTLEQTEDEHDTMSIQYLYQCLEDTAAAINSGHISRRDIKKVLADEQKLVFAD